MTSHPITPDTNDGLDEILANIVLINELHKYMYYDGLKLVITDQKKLDGAKAAINQYMLDTFMELIEDVSVKQWGRITSARNFQDELRKAAKAKLT